MKSATTASMVYEYLPAGAPAAGILWFTGASYPCLSVFAPILLANGVFIPLWTLYDYAEGGPASARAWELGRHRAMRGGGAARSVDPDFVERRDGIQARLVAAAGEAALLPIETDVIASARRAVDGAMAEWEAFLEGD